MNTEVAKEQVALAPAVKDLFVTVPQTILPGVLGADGDFIRPPITVAAFQVARFMASEGRNCPIQVNGVGKPLVNISYHQARTLCKQAGYDLITESQALALAWNLSQDARNWISGVVGEGSMYQGLHIDLDDAVEAYPFDFVSPDASERRAFYLPNVAEPILDAAGNVDTWVFDDIQGDEHGIVARPFAVDSPSITTAPYPSMERGMGWRPPVGRNWSGYALVRGGCWGDGDDAGVFDLSFVSPDRRGDDVGFRCTKSLGV